MKRLSHYCSSSYSYLHCSRLLVLGRQDEKMKVVEDGVVVAAAVDAIGVAAAELMKTTRMRMAAPGWRPYYGSTDSAPAWVICTKINGVQREPSQKGR